MTKTWKRSISMFLALVMVFGMMPMNAFATESEEPQGTETSEVIAMSEVTEISETTEAPEVTQEPEQTEAPEVTEAPVVTEVPEVTEEVTEPAQTEETTVPPETEPVQTEEPTVPEETQAAVVVAPVLEAISDPAMGNVAEEPELVKVAPALQSVVIESEYTNDDMFHMYLDRQFFGDNVLTLGTGGLDGLTDNVQRNLYNNLKSKLAVVADAGGSTDFLVEGKEFETLGFTKTTFTLDEVGMEEWPDGSDLDLVDEVVGKFLEANGLDSGRFVDALMADCPYELYWFDKTRGIQQGFGYEYYPGGDATLIAYEICFAVSDDYCTVAANGRLNLLEVDGTKASAASDAAETARTVAAEQAKDTDYATLKAYKDWITDAVNYNWDAADKNYTGGYGDPWQLIYVFDEDNTNEVVCEGYAKAFQYLCDLALLDEYLDEETACYLAMGTTTNLTTNKGGGHMWNIVNLEGKNYLVDVTNSDEGSFGKDGSLFLAGAEGSVDEGYIFTDGNGGRLEYVYSAKDIYGNTVWPSKEAYGNAAETILTLSATSYEPPEEVPSEPEPSEPDTEMTAEKLAGILQNTTGWYTLTEDITISGTLTIPEGAFLAVEGSEIIVDGGSLVISAGAKLNPYSGANVVVRNGGELVLEGPSADAGHAELGLGGDSTITIAAGATLNNDGVLEIGGRLTVEKNATYIHGENALVLENGTVEGIEKKQIDRFESASRPEEVYAGLDNLRQASGEYRRRILFINASGQRSGADTIEMNGDLNIPEGILVRVGTFTDITTNLVVNGTLHIQNTARVEIFSGGTLTVNQLNNWGELYVPGDGSAYVNRDGRTLGNTVTFENFTQANFEKDLRHHLNANAGYTLTETLTLTDNLTIQTGWGQTFAVGTGGHLIVPAGKTLTIREGEIVLCGTGEMTVNGTLVLEQDANMNDGDNSGYLVADEQSVLAVNSQGNTIPRLAVGKNVTTGAKVNGIDDGDLVAMFFADNAATAEADVYAALQESATYGQTNVYVFKSATLKGEGTSKLLTIPENTYLILHGAEEPTVVTIPEGTTMENDGLIIIRENSSLVVKEGATLKNNNKINNFGTLYLDKAECLIAGEDSVIQENAPLVPGSEGTKSYLSYTWLSNWGDGWFEETNNRFTGSISMAAGEESFVLFYLNTWNSEEKIWERTPVIPKSADSSILSVTSLDEKVQNGQANAAYFVKLEAKDWKQEGVILSAHDVGTAEDATMTVYIGRSPAGFYSQMPIVSGENEMTEEELQAIYMNYVEIDPADPATWEFYFAIDFDHEPLQTPFISDGSEHATITPVEGVQNVYKITVDPETAQNIWTDHSFQFLQVVCKAEFQGKETELYGNLSVRRTDRLDCIAAFILNDVRYEVLRQDVYMVRGDQGPQLVTLPDNVSYDLETNTMTLNGANLESMRFIYAWEDEGREGFDLPNKDLTLKLVGKNTITSFDGPALEIHGGVDLTIDGDGSLYMKADNGNGPRNEHGPYGFDTVNLGRDSSLTVDSGNVTVEITGEAYYWNEEHNEEVPCNLAAIRGNGGSLTINGGSLTTVVPNGAYADNYNEISHKHEGVGYSGLEHFRSVTVTGGKLTTTTLNMHRDDENNWRGTFTQTGGDVIITALASKNYKELYEWSDEEQQDVMVGRGYHYHYEGLGSYGNVDISGGNLKILIHPTYAERSAHSYFDAICMRGAELKISGTGNVIIDNTVSDQQSGDDNNEGSGVRLEDAYNDRGDHIGTGTFAMTGGTLTMNTPDGFRNEFLNMNHESNVQITGGKLATKNTETRLHSNAYIGGNAQWDMTGCVLENHNRFELNENAVMNFYAGSQFKAHNEVQIHGGTMNFGSLNDDKVSVFFCYNDDVNIHDGTLNFNNSSLAVPGHMNVYGGTINITHNKKVEPTEEYDPFEESHVSGCEPFALLVNGCLDIRDGIVNINVESDQYAGITIWNSYIQRGGVVNVNANVSGAPKTTGKAMHNTNEVILQNNAQLNLYGDEAYRSADGSLTLNNNAQLNAYGQSAGLYLEGNTNTWGDSCINAYASGVPGENLLPAAVKAVRGDLWLEGGNHTFKATNTSGAGTDSKVMGLAIYESANVYVYQGKVDIDAEMPVYCAGTSMRLNTNDPHLIMDHGDGDRLTMQPVSGESGPYVLKNGIGGNSGSFVTIYGSLSCGNAAGWNIETDYESDENGMPIAKLRTRLAVGGEQYVNDCYDMSSADASEWVTPEWYRYKEFITHIYVGSVRNLPQYIFGNLSKVTHITIEKTVTQIDDNAFAGCTGLVNIHYEGTEAQWLSAFKGTLPENCVVTFGNGGEEIYYPPVGVTYLDDHGWGWMERQTSSYGDIQMAVGEDRYVIFYRNITSTTEVEDEYGNTRTITVLEEQIPIRPDDLSISDSGKLELKRLLDLEDVEVADNEHNAEYFVRIRALDGWNTTQSISCQIGDTTESVPVAIKRGEDGFYTAAIPNDDNWVGEVWLNPYMAEETTYYFAFVGENGRKLRPDDENGTYFRICYGEEYIQNWGLVEGTDNVYFFQLDQGLIENSISEGVNFELAVEYDVVNAEGVVEDYGRRTGLWFHNGFNADRKAAFEIDGIGYEYYKTDDFEGFIGFNDELFGDKVDLPKGVTFAVDDVNQTATLTLENANLNYMRLGHAWFYRDEWGNIRYDEDGNPIGGVDLPYENLNIVLKGDNTIRNSERTSLELTGGLKVNITSDESGRLDVSTDNTVDLWNEAVRISEESELTISGNAFVNASVNGQSNDFLAVIRGCETGKLILTDEAELVTTVLPDYRYDHRGLERFASIIVEENATLTTESLYLCADWEMGTEKSAEFIQTGGNVRIQGQMVSSNGDYAHASGIQGAVGSVIRITGGNTNINLMPAGNGKYNGETYHYTGISSEGGTVEIGNNANIYVNGDYSGEGIRVNGWGEQKGIFKMSGGKLNIYAHDEDGHKIPLNIDWGTDAQITGGTLNLQGNEVRINSDLTISGNSEVNVDAQLNIDNGVKVTLDGGKLNLTREHSTDKMTGNVYSPGAMDLHPGSTFNLKSGSMTAVNGAFYIRGEFVLDDGTLTIQDGEFYADNVLNVNGGTLKMQQQKNLHHSNTFENRPFQSELGVNGVLNLNGGNIVLNNVYMNVDNCLNLNGGHMTIDAETFNSEERAANQYDDDWMVAARIQDMAQMNVNAGTFTMNGANFETILEVYGEYKQTGGAVTVKDLAPENVRTDNSTFVDHADNTLVLAKGGNISGGSLTTDGGLNGILVHFSYKDDRTHEDGSRLLISGDANVEIKAIETGINMARPVVISGGKVNIDIESMLYEYEDEKYQQYVQAGYGILACGEDIDSSLTISGGTVNINVPTAFDKSEATNADFEKIPDLLGIFSWRNSVNISGGVTHITAMDSLVTRNDRFQDILNIVGMNVVDNANGNVLQEVYGSREIEDRGTMYFRTFESDNVFGSEGSDGFFDAADSITIASAVCGNGTYWSYDGQTKTLKIYGNGEMSNFASPTSAPWNALTKKIENVEITDSVTAIGSYAFAGCSGVQEISLSKAIASIGEGAFQGTSGLTVKVFHNTVAEEYVKSHNLKLEYRHADEDLELVEGSKTLKKCKYPDCDYVQVGKVNEETPVTEILDMLERTLTSDDTAVLKEQLETEILLPSAESIPTAELIEKLDQKLQKETDLEVVVKENDNVLDAPEGAKPAITGAAMNADSDTTVVSLIIDKAEVTADKLEENLENVKPVTVFNMTLQKTQAAGEIENLDTLKIPVTITIPIPASITGDNLKVLHYVDGTDKDPEIITPMITVDAAGNRYAIFVVTGFSTYALAKAPEITIEIDKPEIYLGEELPTLTYKLYQQIDGKKTDVTDELKDELQIELATTATTDALGTYEISVKSYNTRSSYSLIDASTVKGMIKVVKRNVTVAADNIEVDQYDPMQAFTFTAEDANNNVITINAADVTFTLLDQNENIVTNFNPGAATKLAVGTYTIAVTVNQENYPDYEITTESGTLTVKESPYVCWNPDTNVYYDDVSYALDNSSGTIEMLKDATSANNKNEIVIIVGANDTLNLNGFYVETENLLSYGVVKDNKAITGGVKIDFDNYLILTKDNGGYLPVYDTTVNGGCYKFYEFSVNNQGCIPGNNNVAFWYRFEFTNAEGYSVLGRTENSGIKLYADLSWTGITGVDIVHEMPAIHLKNYGINGGAAKGQGMYLKLSGLSKLGDNAVVIETPRVESIAGVRGTARTITYNYSAS